MAPIISLREEVDSNRAKMILQCPSKYKQMMPVVWKVRKFKRCSSKHSGYHSSRHVSSMQHVHTIIA